MLKSARQVAEELTTPPIVIEPIDAIAADEQALAAEIAAKQSAFANRRN
jgi:hypothetical protein